MRHFIVNCDKRPNGSFLRQNSSWNFNFVKGFVPGWLVRETKNFPEKLFFSKISSSFSVLLRQKQVVRNLAIA
jgi:hypothetical protein